MKKIVLFAAIAVIFSSCVKESQEYKDLKAKNDSLVAMNNKKVEEVESYFKRINEIADNFDKLRTAEQFVTTETKSPEKLSKDAVERINENVQLMAQIIQKNKDEIAKLESQVKRTGTNNSQLQKTIDRLKAEQQQKSLTLDSLKMELAAKDEKLAQLGQQVGVLNDAVDGLNKDNRKKAEQLRRQEELLNTAWYVFGSKKELKNQKILTKNGLFSPTKILQNDFNKDYFVKIDIRTTTSIPLYSKHAKVLTNHPITSYVITTENGTKVLQIKNFMDFWSVSKYLVVQVD